MLLSSLRITKTCEYLQLGTQTTWTMVSLFLKAEKEMRVEMQRFIVTFSPTLLLFFGIKRLSHIFYIFLIYKQLKWPTVFSKNRCIQLACLYFLHIFKSTRSLCMNPPNRLWTKLFFQLGIECLKKSARNS